MKILILSDSHGRVGNILDAVEREVPDQVLFLGDVCRDLEELYVLDPMLPVCSVAGNCDGWSGGEEECEITLSGVKCFLTHGHLHQAKLSARGLIRAGMDRGVDAVFFGHTHCPLAERQECGLWLVNPGTIGGVYNRATYAVALAENGSFSVVIKEL